jgi:hypothetical protein
MGSPMSERSAKARSRGNASPKDSRPAARARFVKTLVSVLGVQVITLVLLWLLQSTFSH